MIDHIPSDPAILLSFVNTKLRDVYESLEELCGSLDVSPEEIKRRLEPLNVEYIAELNQFK